MNGRSRFEVYLLPLALDDGLTNLCRRPTLLVLLVGIVNLLEAGSTAGAVRAFKATMQAVMAHAVAIAIAGLLVKHLRNLSCQIVGVSLIGRLSVGAPELVFAKDGRQFCPLGRGSGVESRHPNLFLAGCPLCRHQQRDQKQENDGEASAECEALDADTSGHSGI